MFASKRPLPDVMLPPDWLLFMSFKQPVVSLCKRALPNSWLRSFLIQLEQIAGPSHCFAFPFQFLWNVHLFLQTCFNMNNWTWSTGSLLNVLESMSQHTRSSLYVSACFYICNKTFKGTPPDPHSAYTHTPTHTHALAYGMDWLGMKWDIWISLGISCAECFQRSWILKIWKSPVIPPIQILFLIYLY